MELDALALCFASALAYAAAAVVQERTARRPVAELLRTPKWWAAVGLNAVGAVLHVVALRFGPLSLVQPLGVLTLVLAVPLGALVARRTVGRVAWHGVGLVVSGLGGILMLVSSGGDIGAASAGKLVGSAGGVGGSSAGQLVDSAGGVGGQWAGSAGGAGASHAGQLVDSAGGAGASHAGQLVGSAGGVGASDLGQMVGSAGGVGVLGPGQMVGLLLVAAAVLTITGRRWPAVAGGVAFGVSSALAQTVAVHVAGGGWQAGPLVVSAAAAIVVLSCVGLFFTQRSYRDGFAAPLAVSTLANPVVAAAIGLVLLGERIAGGSVGVALVVVCAVAAGLGVSLLADGRKDEVRDFAKI
ncbi:hypothetical protein AB0J80_34745 [Actinoplanes sp. NPDC049548]|uniref:hypothetical protein n=1 Tax=Actinoplanes sp. NPDC049548 TaxID=3155152 RepID=UPI00344AE5DA